jgi:high-affinity Fe2+/Pb2+ permease
MFVLVLLLLALAAIFGVLGAVLRTVAFLVITGLLTVTVLGALAWWGVKRKARELQEEYDRQIGEQRVTKFRENEAQRPRLDPGRDDRY